MNEIYNTFSIVIMLIIANFPISFPGASPKKHDHFYKKWDKSERVKIKQNITTYHMKVRERE